MIRGALSAFALLALGVTGVAATRGSAVAATLPTPARAALPRCSGQDYALHDVAERGGGKVIGIAWFGLQGRHECRLHTRLTFAVQPARDAFAHPRGVLRGVEGNPAEVSVHAPLTHGAVVVRAWVWRNWCGSRGLRFTLLANPAQPGNAAWSPGVSAPGCGRPAARSTVSRYSPHLHRCADDNLRVRVLPGIGYRTRIIGGVAARLRRGAPCRLRSRLTFAVQGWDAGAWRPLPQIAGNPVRRTVGAVLAPASDTELFFAWENWCGGDGSFRWLADLGRRSFSRAVSQAPACQSAGDPSTLGLSAPG